MSINIKEIFKSDLDPNSLNWWAKDKVDKLNFNFGQLQKGGMPGPTGHQGTPGLTGLQGTQGYEGVQGPRGEQGLEGTPANSIWKINSTSDGITLLPTRMQGIEFSAVGLITGKKNQSNSDYYTSLPFDGPNSTAAVFYGEINRPNFALDYEGGGATTAPHSLAGNELTVGDFLGASDFHIVQNIGGTIHSINRIFIGKENSFDQIPTGLSFTSDLVTSGIKTDFNRPVETYSSLRLVTNEGPNKVIVSTDTDGTVIWKSKYEVFGALPIGSIMSIQEEHFNNANFNLNGNPETEPNGLLLNNQGRGRVDTPFEGWYLCNGQVWEQGITSHDVPNLNSFTFNIDSNNGNNINETTGQPAIINGGDNSQILIGGASLQVRANYISSSGAYDIETINIVTSDSSINFNQPASRQQNGSYEHSKMVHIINLGEPTLQWKSEPSTSVTTEPITLSEVSNTAAAACTTTFINDYMWTGIDVNWITGNGGSGITGTQLYLNGSLASAGWYEKDSTAREWSGTAWTDVQICLQLDTYELLYKQDVRDLNWTQPPSTGSNGYLIEDANGASATTFKFAYIIKNADGTSPPAGWYRSAELGQSAWYRAYWNGTVVQYRTALDYMHYVGKMIPYESLGTGACSANNAAIDIYYGSSNNTVPTSNRLQFLEDQGPVVLVNDGWVSNTSANIGRSNLVSISSQNRPGSSNTWQQLYDGISGERGTLTFNSKITNDPGVASCISAPQMSTSDNGDDLDTLYYITVNGQAGDTNQYYYSWRVYSSDAFEGSITISGPGITGASTSPINQEDGTWRNGTNFTLNSQGVATNLNYTLNSLGNEDDYDMELYIRLHKSSDDSIMSTFNAIG